MIPIKININELVEEFNLSKNDIDDLKEEILSGLCNELKRVWIKEASGSSLRTTKKVYINSIEVFKDNQFVGGVGLIKGDTWLPNAVESGLPPFDIKPGELKSSKVKIGKRGQNYIRIPFRIGTPRTVSFGTTMPSVVYQIAKSLKGKKQIKTHQLPSEMQIPQTRDFIKTQTQIFDSYTHTAPIFSGIQKGQGKYHGQYHTFRTISSMSENSNWENSWIHKGIQAYNLAEKAIDNTDVEYITDQTIDRFLDEKLG